jgi:CHAT domain-containing protein
VCQRFGGAKVTPAEQAQLDAMLTAKPVGLLHFIAHGKSTGQATQTLQLENNAVFNAVQVRGMEGLENACRAKAPLIFLNACEVGRTTPSLVGAGGFATEFIKAGARCVVAPLWSVKDSLAHEVAIAFYEAALADPSRSFADILRDIRQKSYAQGGGEDTYAAYCLYGDPLTALSPPD